MSGITLAQAESKLASALTAYEDALEIYSYNTSSAGGSMQVTRHSLDQLERAVTFWEQKVQRLSASRKGIRITGITPTG